MAKRPPRRAGQALVCGWCSREFVPADRGRTPKWCSQGCRQRAWEQRRAARSGLVAVDVVHEVVEVEKVVQKEVVKRVEVPVRPLDATGPLCSPSLRLSSIAASSTTATYQSWRRVSAVRSRCWRVGPVTSGSWQGPRAPGGGSRPAADALGPYRARGASSSPARRCGSTSPHCGTALPRSRGIPATARSPARARCVRGSCRTAGCSRDSGSWSWRASQIPAPARLCARTSLGRRR